MTMKIDGNNGIGPVAGLKKARQTEEPKAASGVSARDKVQFSAVLQDVSRAREAGGVADSNRAEKVQAIKEQVASGNYRPDLTKVAASLLKFITEEK